MASVSFVFFYSSEIVPLEYFYIFDQAKVSDQVQNTGNIDDNDFTLFSTEIQICFMNKLFFFLILFDKKEPHIAFPPPYSPSDITLREKGSNMKFRIFFTNFLSNCSSTIFTFTVSDFPANLKSLPKLELKTFSKTP